MEAKDQVQLVKEAVENIPQPYFDHYPGGWPDQISLALVDAVFSIGARYETTEGKGVLPRLQRLSKSWDEASQDPRNSLMALTEYNEALIREFMGSGKVAPGKSFEKYKSIAAIEAAQEIQKLGINSSEDLISYWYGSKKQQSDLRKAYTSVYGLGKVTFEYFLMLLGLPGVKADRMITRFVATAIGASSITAERAHSLIMDSYQESSIKHAVSLISFEHGIWLYQSERS